MAQNCYFAILFKFIHVFLLLSYHLKSKNSKTIQKRTRKFQNVRVRLNFGQNAHVPAAEIDVGKCACKLKIRINSHSVIKSILTRVEILTITKSKWNKLEWLRLFHQVFVCLANVGEGFSMAIVIYTNGLVTLFIFFTLITSIPFLEFSYTSSRGNPPRPPPFAFCWISNWN